MRKIFTGQRLLKLGTIAVYVFIFAPILIVVLMSFHPREIVSFPLPGFSLRWYKEFITNYTLLNSLRISLTIGLGAALLAGVIGTLAAFALVRAKFRGKEMLNAMIFAPMLISPVVMGVALLSFFDFIHFPRGYVSVIVAHSLITLPFVVVVVAARLSDFDRSLEWAAMNLGANHFQTFKSITFPLIAPGIIGGMLLAFTLSFDEYPATQFLATPGTTTVPIRIFSMIKTELNPQINVLATILIAVTIIVPVLTYYFLRKKEV
jgi:spermidine/putrescine transport system permease protein